MEGVILKRTLWLLRKAPIYQENNNYIRREDLVKNNLAFMQTMRTQSIMTYPVNLDKNNVLRWCFFLE